MHNNHKHNFHFAALGFIKLGAACETPEEEAVFVESAETFFIILGRHLERCVRDCPTTFLVRPKPRRATVDRINPHFMACSRGHRTSHFGKMEPENELMS